jgi:hypothetical protein
MMKKFIDLSTTTASLTRTLSLSVLMVGCLSSASWGQAKVAEIVGNPTVNDDRVTVRIKVKSKEDRPVMGLEDTNFRLILDNQEVTFKNKDWKSSEETVPPPGWIVVLLDFSGSMEKLDSRGTKKIEGAINAIREFNRVSAERGGSTQIAIVPFGVSGSGCEGYPVNKKTLNKFFLAGDFKLQNHLDYLAGKTPCASTNLYEPLNKAIRFLADTNDPRFHPPKDSTEPQPRLSIILLSDGYHNAKNEEQDFKTLASLLKKNEDITVHTLGYGLTPKQLREKYKIGRPATRADIGKGKGKVPAEEFVDQVRLAEIANLTNGIAEFSGDAEAIAKNLQLFLNALLGEYEITYTEPNVQRGSKHDVRVVVKSPDGSSVTSESKSYTITVFGRSLPLQVRLTILLCIFLAMGVGGVVPFYFWGQHLKQEALDD